MSHVRLCLVLHNHQPVGNFEHVIQQAFEDSYRPFLDCFESYESLQMSLHVSGPLMEWFADNQPQYLDRLANLVQAGRIEIVGGAFYEPILTMIPPRDRVGQIGDFTQWLENRLGGEVKSAWIPERVWEQSLASDLHVAGIRHTVLDDYHFRCAGLNTEQLHGYFVTEDQGRVLNVFPGSERLRYLIPFRPPHETIEFLGQVAATHPDAVVVFGDDGEKFGTWPETKVHVYDNGWLRQFFDALVENQEWIKTTTLSEAASNTLPAGKVYLPDASYREMTEWSLPADRQQVHERNRHDLEHDSHWSQRQVLLHGGFWRNFKTKYAESNDMYSRMMLVSQRLEQVEKLGVTHEQLKAARKELYRGQCNCSYWHGAFGGIYLPHLRNAVYNHLIAADNLLDNVTERQQPWVEATSGDFNYDSRQEVRLANDRLICFIAANQGGQLYELDVRSICHNLIATLMRRPEMYHEKVKQGPSQPGEDVSSIHDRVVFKQADLDQHLHFDEHPRRTLMDHFYDPSVSLDDVVRSQAREMGDFVSGAYQASIHKNPNRIQVRMERDGRVDGQPVSITKGVTLEGGENVLEFAYRIEGLYPGQVLHFAPELNFAGLPAGADDRFFFRNDHETLGQLGSQLSLTNETQLGLIDQWLGIAVRLSANRPMDIWTYPVETVSQSEGGFELVHQSVVVQPHWIITADESGSWHVKLQLEVDTSLAESRMQQSAVEPVSL